MAVSRAFSVTSPGLLNDTAAERTNPQRRTTDHRQEASSLAKVMNPRRRLARKSRVRDPVSQGGDGESAVPASDGEVGSDPWGAGPECARNLTWAGAPEG